MSKFDPYLYDDLNVLKNKLNITDEKQLNEVETALSSASMSCLYDSGFSDFSVSGICKLHKIIFGEVYDWAGQYRIINIQKREPLLAGKSVWYSNWDDIEKDLNNAWHKIEAINWGSLSHKDFSYNIAHLFPAIWQVHPFREGNTRTVVMLIAMFVEHYGYYFDYELISSCAGYVRNAFVLSCFGEYSEFEHLEKILYDAICTSPIEDDKNETADIETSTSKYKKYQSEDYKPVPHEYVEYKPKEE